MKITETHLDGVLLLEPRVFPDQRGFFLETYQSRRYEKAGIGVSFVQDNHSRSTMGVLRGLHLQVQYPQGKLVYAVRGRIWDVAVDVDPASPTFRQWFGAELSDETQRQLYVPPGYAHGFVVLSEVADVVYKCTDYYAPGDEAGLLWNDPELAIDWPQATPVLSERDAANLTLADYLNRYHP